MSKTVTKDDLITVLKEINPNIEVLGEYVTAKKPIHCRCKKCLHEWDPTPSNLKKGRGCPKCNKKYHLSAEEFLAEVTKNNPTIEILGDYVDQHTRIAVRCKICGKQWFPITQSILIGTTCKSCASKKSGLAKRLSHEEICQRMKKAHPEIEILGQYIDREIPVKCKCTVCGYEWSPKGASLQAATGCPSCTHQLSLSHDEFVDIISKLSPSIEILGTYKKRNSRIACRCKICGYTWNPVANSLIVGTGCSQCANRARDERNLALRKSQEQFVSELEQINPNIEVIGTYVNSTTKVLVHCRHCGNTWKAAPPKLLIGNGCPECSSTSTSFMEKMILESFRYCLGQDAVLARDTKATDYELDIYIPALAIAIEPGSWFWHQDKVDRDRKKRETCAANGIRLITIYDCYNLKQKPFETDCYTTPVDLGQEKGHETLKFIIDSLFDLCGMDCDYSPETWSIIEDRAYLSARKMNTEEFKLIMAEINPAIEVLGEYKSSSKKIHCRCKTCGHEWNPIVSDLTHNNAGCPKCAGRMKRTHSEFVQLMAKKHPSLLVLGQYVNSQTHVEVQCKICGHVWPVKPNNLMKGTGCSECGKIHSSIKQRKTHEQFMQDMVEKGNPSVEVVGLYKNSKTKIACRCKVCGYEWSTDPSVLLSGHGCKACADNAKRGKRPPKKIT